MIEKPQVRPEVKCGYADVRVPLPTYRVRVTQDGLLEVDV